jgi:hypothetical protein
MFSIEAISGTRLPLNRCGTFTAIVEMSSAAAYSPPRELLMRSTIFIVVEKSLVCRLILMACWELKSKGTARSTTAPFGMIPTVVMFLDTLADSPLAENPPRVSDPWARSVDVAVDALERGDQEHAALEALGVADRGDGHVQPAPRPWPTPASLT